MGTTRGSKARKEGWPDGCRRCLKCNKIKLFEDFHKHKYSYGGVTTECKDCRKAKSKRDYEKTSLEYRLLFSAKSRAKKKGLDFNLDLSDIKIPEICPVFKTKFVTGTQYAASLDRTDNTKGYVKGNVEVISKRANAIKGDSCVEDLIELIEYLKERSV